MATTRFSKSEIEVLRNLQAAREKGEGDASWIDDLPELPDQSAEDSVIAVMIPKKEKSTE